MSKRLPYDGPALGILHGGHIPRRLVQDEIEPLDLGGDQPAVHADLIAIGVRPVAQLPDDAVVDLHLPGKDQLPSAARLEQMPAAATNSSEAAPP